MTTLIPRRLRSGDTVAVLSPSWGGPHDFPAVYERGLDALRQWGLTVVEYPTTRMSPARLAESPELRARDLNAAFADPRVNAIIASIGGDDSVRILPFLDAAVIAANPKILLGYSDTTTLHLFCQQLGMVTMHGPTVMAGFAQFEAMPQYAEHVRHMLFEGAAEHRYEPYAAYSEGYPDWGDPQRVGEINPPTPADGWRLLQGTGSARGRLAGGCIEVLERVRTSAFWPGTDFWRDRILVLETSEEVPTVAAVESMIRAQGPELWSVISAVVVGRARGYTDTEKLRLDNMIVRMAREEFGRADLPILSNVDIGHSDPQLVLPLGATARLDTDPVALTVTERWAL